MGKHLASTLSQNVGCVPCPCCPVVACCVAVLLARLLVYRFRKNQAIPPASRAPSAHCQPLYQNVVATMAKSITESSLVIRQLRLLTIPRIPEGPEVEGVRGGVGAEGAAAGAAVEGSGVPPSPGKTAFAAHCSLLKAFCNTGIIHCCQPG